MEALYSLVSYLAIYCLVLSPPFFALPLIMFQLDINGIHCYQHAWFQLTDELDTQTKIKNILQSRLQHSNRCMDTHIQVYLKVMKTSYLGEKNTIAFMSFHSLNPNNQGFLCTRQSAKYIACIISIKLHNNLTKHDY